MKPKCHILVGVPGSGKSTWVKKSGYGNISRVLSSDDVIESIAQRYGFTYDESFKALINFSQMVFNQHIDECLEHGYNTIIDRTNLTPKVRKQFINRFKQKGFEVVAVVFQTPEEEEWKRRLKRPGKTIPQDILNSMKNNFTVPTLDEGFDDIIHV